MSYLKGVLRSKIEDKSIKMMNAFKEKVAKKSVVMEIFRYALKLPIKF